MNVGDFCFRDKYGVAHLSLPFRVQLLDGTTRTDPDQWFNDITVREETGWNESILTQEDIDRLFPPPPPPVEPVLTWLELGYDTGLGWRLAWQADDVALLTGLYVLAKRSKELGIDQPVVVTDMDGVIHSMTFEEYETLLLQYGAARMVAAMPEPEPEIDLDLDTPANNGTI